MFLKVFDIYENKHGIWSQKFAAEMTIFWTPDEIGRFDGCLWNVKKAIYIKIIHYLIRLYNLKCPEKYFPFYLGIIIISMH
jgi:hypothetical protein